MYCFFNTQIALITKYQACISLTADFHLILIFNIWHKSCKLIFITHCFLYDQLACIKLSSDLNRVITIAPFSPRRASLADVIYFLKSLRLYRVVFHLLIVFFWIFLVLRCLIKCDMNLNETAWLNKDYIWLYLSWVYLMACKGRTCRCS